MSEDKLPPTTPDNAEVGYSQPPKQHRFKKGQSGNPRGRPRHRLSPKSMKLIMREEFLRPVTVVENGKRKQLPLFQILLRKNLAEVMSGSGSLSKLTSDCLRILLQGAGNNEFSTEESIQSILDHRPTLTIGPGAELPKNPII